jgi:hypothetical protein
MGGTCSTNAVLPAEKTTPADKHLSRYYTAETSVTKSERFFSKFGVMEGGADVAMARFRPLDSVPDDAAVILTKLASYIPHSLLEHIAQNKAPQQEHYCEDREGSILFLGNSITFFHL